MARRPKPTTKDGLREPRYEAPVIYERCMFPDCDHVAVVLMANDAALMSPEYREWWACRWHQRNSEGPSA